MGIRRALTVATAALAAIAAVVVIAPNVASAHHPVISGVATCVDTGGWKITWTATSDAPTRGKTWKIKSSDPSAVWTAQSGTTPDGQGFIPESKTWSTSVTYPQSTASATMKVTAVWNPSVGDQTRTSASVARPADCAPGSITVTVTCTTVTITSTKAISNVVKDFSGSTPDEKIDGLSGTTYSFPYTPDLVGVWVKSGNNASGDGPGYGKYFPITAPTGCVEPVELNLTYNQDCAPDATNTWRISYVSGGTTGASVPFTLSNAPGTFNQSITVGGPEVVINASRQYPITATLTWADGSATKAAGPDLTASSHPEKCGITPAEPSVVCSTTTPSVLQLIVPPNTSTHTYSVSPADPVFTEGQPYDVSVTATAIPPYQFGEQTTKTWTFTGTVDCIPNTFKSLITEPVCESDVPYISWTTAFEGFDPDLTTDPITVRLYANPTGDDPSDPANYTELVDEFESTSLSDSVIYPGASESGGVATDWPGWKEEPAGSGNWVVDPSDQYLRTGILVELSINPTTSQIVSYPLATPDCANPPVTPVPPTVECIEGTLQVVGAIDTDTYTYEITGAENLTEGSVYDITVTATPAEGYIFAEGAEFEWNFTGTVDCIPDAETTTPTADYDCVEDEIVVLDGKGELLADTESVAYSVTVVTEPAGQGTPWKIEITATPKEGYEFPEGTVSEWTLEGVVECDRDVAFSVLEPVCESDVPYIKWGANLVGDYPAGTPITVTLLSNPSGTDSKNAAKYTKQEAQFDTTSTSGLVIYPGASESGGVATDWPGWKESPAGSGNWVVDPTDQYRRTGILVRLSVNPSAQAIVSYPLAKPDCANPPVTPAAPTVVCVEGTLKVLGAVSTNQVIYGVTGAGKLMEDRSYNITVTAQAGRGFRFADGATVRWTFTGTVDCRVSEQLPPPATTLPPASAPPGGLPATGSSTSTVLAIGAFAALAGAGAMFASRRRRPVS
jgi:LPXTG-motif cell wall-anchored protein